MDLERKIRIFIVLQSIIVVFMFILLIDAPFSVPVVVMLSVAEIGALAYLFIIVERPMEALKRLLKLCLTNENSARELLEQGSNEVAYVNTINNIVKICSAQATKENYDKQAELAALQSQINPHFLYNTLESIRAQALIDKNDEIAKMVETLAGFFRYSISRKGELVTLRDELANVENYMMIHQYRFGDRFSMQILIEKEDEIAFDYLVPRLVIQPIVENAIYHGLKEKLEDGIITIEITPTDNDLILMVSDNGEGMDSKSLMALNKRIKAANQFLGSTEEDRGMGIALPNIHKRIQLLFGEEYGIDVYSTLNLGTDVEILLPANFERTPAR